MMRRLAPGLVVMVAAASLVGCASNSTKSGDSDGVLTDATLGNSPTSLIQEVALNQGFFKQQGLTVKVISVASGPAAASLMVSGGADIADIAGPTVIALAAGKTPVKFLSDAEGTNIDVFGRAALKNDANTKEYPENMLVLKGKRLGVPARGSAIEAIFDSMLKDAGLDAERDVTFIATGTVATTVAALKSGQIDYTLWPASVARTVFQPTVDLYTLASTDEDNVGTAAGKLLSGAEVVSAKTAQTRSGDLVKYCKAMGQASDWMKDPNNLDAVAKTAAQWLGIKDPALAKTAARLTGATAIPKLSEEQWNNNLSLFPTLGSPSYASSIFAPCF